MRPHLVAVSSPSFDQHLSFGQRLFRRPIANVSGGGWNNTSCVPPGAFVNLGVRRKAVGTEVPLFALCRPHNESGILLADVGASVTILDKADQVVARLGHDNEWEKRVMNRELNIRGKRDRWIPGKFVHPHDACFDRHGNIFVSEYVLGGQVTKLRKV